MNSDKRLTRQRSSEWSHLKRAPWLPLLGALILIALLLLAMGAQSADPMPAPGTAPVELFETSGLCMSCHNGLVTPTGRDVSIGAEWRASMMANASRDPYWQAAVRRETLDHPPATAAIERECSTCHMPMAHYSARLSGKEPGIFENLPVRVPHLAQSRSATLAADGVGCLTCHQISAERLGTRESFVGKFVIERDTPAGQRTVYGPFDVDRGRNRIMHSATGFIPARGEHIQESAVCASCHTLITHALDENHEVVGELPEQVPYLEWLHSDYVNQKSCQDCHMPLVGEEVGVSSVWGLLRADVSRHAFRGGNFLIPRMFSRYGSDLGVVATPVELQASVNRTIEHLGTRAASVRVVRTHLSETGLQADIEVVNRAGHKLPTAYPSRRVWLHLTVTDGDGGIVFESGTLRADGSIVGNDNDESDGAFEPHYQRISSPDQVQVYEAIMVDPQDSVTTGLTSGLRFVKDNRLLPLGFDKETADNEIAVHGAAWKDDDFGEHLDRIRYDVGLDPMAGPFDVRVELWYQPIGYRWARNLGDYDAMETRRFVDYYDEMSEVSATLLASDLTSAR